MFSNRSVFMPVMLVFTAFLGASAFAADTATGKIPFPFLVGDQQVPAGVYLFKVDRVDATVTVRGPKKANTVGFVTTMAAKAHSTATDADFVFDKVGETYTLSEIWMPGAEGVLVHATKGKHQHEIIHLEPTALRSDSR